MVRINEGVALVPELACINIQGFSYLSIKDMDLPLGERQDIYFDDVRKILETSL